MAKVRIMSKALERLRALKNKKTKKKENPVKKKRPIEEPIKRSIMDQPTSPAFRLSDKDREPAPSVEDKEMDGQETTKYKLKEKETGAKEKQEPLSIALGLEEESGENEVVELDDSDIMEEVEEQKSEVPEQEKMKPTVEEETKTEEPEEKKEEIQQSGVVAQLVEKVEQLINENAALSQIVEELEERMEGMDESFDAVEETLENAFGEDAEGDTFSGKMLEMQATLYIEEEIETGEAEKKSVEEYLKLMGEPLLKTALANLVETNENDEVKKKAGDMLNKINE